jgi:poly-gamma-glutamate capsule biosynthesis protein CapA/YwtB (metallophosphatase superfamily)
MSNTEEMRVVVDLVGDFMITAPVNKEDVRAAASLLAGADVVIANVDTVLSDKGVPTPKWANLRGPRAGVNDLKAMGIDVVAMANNHSMDYRAEGMLDSCAAYDEVGILHAGAGANLATATAPAVITSNGVKIAILSIASTLPVESAAGPETPGIAPVHVNYAFEVDEGLMPEQPGSVPRVKTWIDDADLGRAVADVRRAKESADVVLVVEHWGVPSPWRAPYHAELQDYQQPLGHALIDAGADAVIGNHAHELHGIEFYRGRPIAYCLGNFWIEGISQYAWMGFESGVLRLTVDRGGVTGVSFLPAYLDAAGIPRPDPGNRAIAILNRLSAQFGVRFEPGEGGYFVAKAGS